MPEAAIPPKRDFSKAILPDYRPNKDQNNFIEAKRRFGTYEQDLIDINKVQRMLRGETGSPLIRAYADGLLKAKKDGGEGLKEFQEDFRWHFQIDPLTLSRVDGLLNQCHIDSTPETRKKVYDEMMKLKIDNFVNRNKKGRPYEDRIYSQILSSPDDAVDTMIRLYDLSRLYEGCTALLAYRNLFGRRPALSDQEKAFSGKSILALSDAEFDDFRKKDLSVLSNKQSAFTRIRKFFRDAQQSQVEAPEVASLADIETKKAIQKREGEWIQTHCHPFSDFTVFDKAKETAQSLFIESTNTFYNECKTMLSNEAQAIEFSLLHNDSLTNEQRFVLSQKRTLLNQEKAKLIQVKQDMVQEALDAIDQKIENTHKLIADYNNTFDKMRSAEDLDYNTFLNDLELFYDSRKSLSDDDSLDFTFPTISESSNEYEIKNYISSAFDVLKKQKAAELARVSNLTKQINSEVQTIEQQNVAPSATINQETDNSWRSLLQRYMW